MLFFFVLSVCSLNTFKLPISVGTIRRMVDYSSVTVCKDGRSLSFSNNRFFSLNVTYPTVPQYMPPRIFLTYFRYF